MTGILGRDRLGAFLLGVGNELKLIYDRTAADVERAEYLNSLWADGVFTGTDEELAEWYTPLRGAYNAADLNRVEGAAETLSQKLRDLPDRLHSFAELYGVGWDAFFDIPYDPTAYGVTVKTDWTRSDIQLPAEMERYLANVELLCSALEYSKPELPAQIEDLTWEGANAIEKALVGLNDAIKALQTDRKTKIHNTAAAWHYSGELYAGEV